jgi:hypothetical protein
MTFAGLMTNIKGPQAGKPLRLMGWQHFIFANLFGFVERGTRLGASGRGLSIVQGATARPRLPLR